MQKYKTEKWDWTYLTEFGGFLMRSKKDNEKYLEQLIKQFPKIKFGILSKRKDIKIEKKLILSTRDKNWDWKVLSENEKAEISIELISELKNKQWNWQALSKRKNIEFRNDAILQLIDKDWDWNYLSTNERLEFNSEFIEKTKAKSWNWKLVSRHKSFSPSMEILTLTKDFDLDWEYISKHSSLNLTKEILAKFENKWHWQSLTQNSQINFENIDIIERFEDKWDWHFMCKCGKLPLTHEILNKFKVHLDWNLISSNTNLNFTKNLIQEFKPYWNWSNLKANNRIQENLGNYISELINDSPILTFISKIGHHSSNWKGKIYHFSHIDNAVKIIREKKIKSRDTAKQLSDSAGNVVFSRPDGHKYARFYFRPHTQTQFYNEYLGVDSKMGYIKNGEWHSWYEKEYRMLDFPKCPKPIYFEFSLQEVVFNQCEKCNISTGNMQRKRTRFGKIDDMVHLFNFEDLFINPGIDSQEWNKFREFAQQELMIEGELDFSKLNYKIICATDDDKKLLIQLLGLYSLNVIDKIFVDKSYYRNRNPMIDCIQSDNKISISTLKKDDGYFVLSSAAINSIQIIQGDIIKQDEKRLFFKSNIQIENTIGNQIRVTYIDEVKKEYLVFANYKLELKDIKKNPRFKEIKDAAL